MKINTFCQSCGAPRRVERSELLEASCLKCGGLVAGEEISFMERLNKERKSRTEGVKSVTEAIELASEGRLTKATLEMARIGIQVWENEETPQLLFKAWMMGARMLGVFELNAIRTLLESATGERTNQECEEELELDDTQTKGDTGT